MSDHEAVQLIARSPDGTQTIPVGKIHPAQARRLVKLDYAAWEDGKCLFLLRPAMASLLANSPAAWLGPQDDEGRVVSPAEMDRRKAWFLNLIQTTARTVARTGDSNVLRILDLAQQPWDDQVTPSTAYLNRDHDPQDDIWFQNDETGEALPTLDGLEDLWETAPTINGDRFELFIKPELPPRPLTEERLAAFRAERVAQMRQTPTPAPSEAEIRAKERLLLIDRTLSSLNWLNNQGAAVEFKVLPIKFHGGAPQTRLLLPDGSQVHVPCVPSALTRTEIHEYLATLGFKDYDLGSVDLA